MKQPIKPGAIYARAWRAKNAGRYQAYRRAYAKRNRDRINAYARAYLPEWRRKNAHRLKCASCGIPESPGNQASCP